MNREDEFIMNVRDLFNKLTWLNKIKMEVALKDYKPSEVHCIEYIGNNDDVNVTKMAEVFFMTRSAMSKTAKKLMAKGAIESYQKAENKKEIYFKLTEKGQEAFNIHEKLHKEFRKRDSLVFKELSAEEFICINSFIEKYQRHLDEEVKKIGKSIYSE